MGHSIFDFIIVQSIYYLNSYLSKNKQFIKLFSNYSNLKFIIEKLIPHYGTFAHARVYNLRPSGYLFIA